MAKGSRRRDPQVAGEKSEPAHLVCGWCGSPLKKVVDEATQTTHATELEAVHLAIRSRPIEETSTSLRDVLERLGSPKFEAILSRVRETLQMAMSR